MRRSSLLAFGLALVLGCCSKSDRAVNEKELFRKLLKEAERDFDQAQALHADGKSQEAATKCMLLGLEMFEEEKLPEARDLLAAAGTFCRHSLPLAIAESEVAALETKLAKLEDNAFDREIKGVECAGQIHYKMAMDLLKAHHPDDPKVPALQQRMESACGDTP